MIIVMGHAKFAAGEIERLDAAIQAQIIATNAEDGCDYYCFARDVTNPDRMVVSERWRDQVAIDAHFQTPHMAAFNEELGKAQLLELSIKSYDLKSGEIKQLMGG
jgi:quinol monooxygenase YgiN